MSPPYRRSVMTRRSGVLLDVGVEQEERDAAHVGPPHLGVERLTGEVDR